MRVRRTRLDLIVALLETVDRNPNVSMSRVSAYAGLNPSVGKKLVVYLNHKGFLEVHEGDKIARGEHAHLTKLTAKGRTWLVKLKTLLGDVEPLLEAH
ncbi:MAG: hypothetical protein HWN68_18555 [Desulfobacterales bacterium]|nr:hypothetical protein [Desulfobacterales bacterium]